MTQPNLSIVRELVQNPAFQRWVLDPEGEDRHFWKSYLTQYPEREREVAFAKNIVQTLGFRANTADNTDFIEVWQQIHPRTQPTRQITRWAWAAAASVIFLLGTFFVYQHTLSPTTQVYQTGYGETQTVWLPDSSQVILNANSQLAIQGSWTEQREVQLQGEAYFTVKKQYQSTSGSESDRSNPVKFVVQAGEVTIEVLGTSFNVTEYAQRVAVVLEEGKVQLRTDQQSEITLEPGERAEFQPQTQELSKQVVNTNTYTAWRDNQYQFENTSLTDIATLMERTYGVSVIMTDEALADRKITATIPSTELTTLLAVLQETLNLTVRQKGEEIILSKK